MPTIQEVAAFVEEFAPAVLAEEWDNVGTLVNCGTEITGIMCTLDITPEVVQEAELQNCQLILAHHPVIFQPLRSISGKDITYTMIKRGISAICAHTNLDAAAGGVNDVLASVCGITNPVPFAGIGRIGTLREVVSATEFAGACAKKFGTKIRVVDAGRPVQVLAVVGGSGGRFVQEAIRAGASCVLTGEADHHDALEAKQAGVSLIVAGHYATEFPMVPVMADRLLKRFPNTRIRVSRRNKDPFVFVG